MKLTEREEVTHVPGTSQTNTKKTVEWVCAGCEYFEEADLSDMTE